VSKILAAIEAPHFLAGIVLREDKVIEAADIVKYMKGWTRDRVRAYCKGKGWDVSVVTAERSQTERGAGDEAQQDG
jgi:hypothetical protein